MPNWTLEQLQERLAANPSLKMMRSANRGVVASQNAQKVLAAYEGAEISSGGAKRAKYGNVKIEGHDRVWDSKKEYAHYQYLVSELMAKRILKIEIQPEFSLDVNGVHICKYRADFRVTYPDQRIEVQDVKSTATKKLPVYSIKKKLMFACLGIEITEI